MFNKLYYISSLFIIVIRTILSNEPITEFFHMCLISLIGYIGFYFCFYILEAIYLFPGKYVEFKAKQLIKDDDEIKRYFYSIIDNYIKNNKDLRKIITEIAYRCIKEHDNYKRSLGYKSDN